MSKFWLITKINILNFFNIKTISNSKYKSERKKNSLKILFVIFIVLYISWYIYIMCKELMPAFVMLGEPIYLLALLFTITSMYILYANIFKIKSTLFDFKDYDLLMSLPIKRNIVISSKIGSLYILNLFYALIVMVPGYLAYIRFADLPYDVLYFILIFTIPIVPILLSSIVGIILAWLTSFIKNKNIGTYIIYISVIFLAFFISYKMNEMDSTKVSMESINLVNTVSRYYPLTNNYINLLNKITIVDLIVYFMIPLFLGAVFILLTNKFYIGIRTRLLRTSVKDDYEVRNYTTNSSLIGLYKKELKRYITCPIYLINSSFGCILIFVMIIALLIFNDNSIANVINMPDFSEMIKGNVFMILAMVCAMSSTTSSSISLEGKSYWIMKMLPVSSDKIILSKVMLNLTVLIPTILISGTFFGIYLHFGLAEFLLIYLVPFVYAIFISIIGILFNLMFPRFDYETEIKVVKQSLAVFLTILVGFLAIIVPLTLHKITIDYLIFLTIIISLIDVILGIVIHYYGKKKFIKL